jgi:hypothetical protein
MDAVLLFGKQIAHNHEAVNDTVGCHEGTMVVTIFEIKAISMLAIGLDVRCHEASASPSS